MGALGAPMPDVFTWHNNLLHAMRTRPVLILHGNIRDRYVFARPPHHHEIPLDELLARLLSPIYGQIRRFDPYSKVVDLSLGEADIFSQEAVPEFGGPGFNNTTDPTIARLLGDMENRGQRKFWLLKYAHNMLPFRSAYSQEEGLRLAAFQRMIEQIAPKNRLILCYLSDTQVPLEISQQSHRVAFLKVPLPDYAERRAFWVHRDVGDELASELSKFTDGLALTSLQTLVQLASEGADGQQRELKNLSTPDWERVIAQFKFGESRNYYQQITVDQLSTASRFFIEQEGIKGQDLAVKKAIQMLWLARTNVASLLRTGPSNAPRGVLFCCGPSGTGKTLLGKKLAKFVFGSEAAFHRIDMSEYQQDYTVSKLIGAPPGYVGHEAGGALTNAILERPFSVVLFDEIEKAHPRVFDLFLQVLSDGRLTDSRGQTVFFSEAIIVFTSNIGTRSNESAQLEEARRSDNPAKVRDHFVHCVRNYFRFEISRPELLNRIGNNIVPFDFLDAEDVLTATVRFYLEFLQERFNGEHAEENLRLAIDHDGVATFLSKEYGVHIREFGGRAVLNTIQDVVLPELAKRLLELEQRKGPRAMITLRVVVGNQGGARKVVVHA
jgi:hypothetical protein